MFGYISVLLAQLGTSGKQYSMKNCGRLAPGSFNSICINMMRASICLVVSFVLWIVSGMGATTFLGHVVIVLSGVGTALNLYTWILATRIITLTLFESLAMIGTMVLPMILAPYLYAGERVSVFQWIGCALVFVSTFLFMNKDTTEKEECPMWKKILIIATSVIGLSASFILKKLYTYHFTDKGLGSIEYYTLINFVTIVLFFIVFFIFSYFKESKKLQADCKGGECARVELPYKKVWAFVLIAAASLYLNELFTVYAQQNLPQAVYAPLARGLTVLCSFLLDVIVFKDKVTLKKIIGLLVVTAAIILVNI